MLVLGFNGTYFRPDEESVFPFFIAHDSSAVLLDDGEVVAAIEEERPSRIKHSSKGPFRAIQLCLDERKIALSEVDRFAFYFSEDVPDDPASFLIMSKGKSLREVWQAAFEKNFGVLVDPKKFVFVKHHLAHATSAHVCAGFEESLVMTFDGNGERLSGVVARGHEGGIDVIHQYETGDWRHDSRSLGYYYWLGVRILGYGFGDEYKVMGLAPYGDPSRFRSAIQATYQLKPGGDYVLHLYRFAEVARQVGVRTRGDAFTQVHKDFAASLQEGFEQIVLHAVRHFRAATGLRKLSLAGGCAHNSTMTGKLLYSGLFDEVFVQPAADDAGCALGAALHVDASLRATPRKSRPLQHVYWGTRIEAEAIEPALSRWSELLSFEKSSDIVADAAQLLAQGAAIGWIQGRSEFGPRALGNRSILADPRPAQNKDLINALVKKREAYRPFAPAVTEECAGDYFELPAAAQKSPFMTFVVRVKEDKQQLLGAVTHVDGTARVQTVSRAQNEIFWRLLDAFGRRSGVPMLLNTSFNNNAEPIVDSIEDAIVCFLTTGLQHLIIGDFKVEKKPVALTSVLPRLIPSLPIHLKIRHLKQHGRDGWSDSYGITNTIDPGFARILPKQMYDLLLRADGRRNLAHLLKECLAESEQCLLDVLELWNERLIVLRPE